MILFIEGVKIENKHKFFAMGILLGFVIPFAEHYLEVDEEVNNPFERFLLIGTSIWHYIFLYLVVINSIFLYVKRLRDRINPNSKIIFLISGISAGFALVSLIAATITYFELI